MQTRGLNRCRSIEKIRLNQAFYLIWCREILIGLCIPEHRTRDFGPETMFPIEDLLLH